MHRQFVHYSRTEPARTILWAVALSTAAMQVLGFFIHGGFFNAAFVVAICGWAVGSCYKNSVKHMSMSSFWLFMLWLFSGCIRLVVTHDWTLMLWAPMLIVAVVMSVVYLYLSYQRRVLRNGDLD